MAAIVRDHFIDLERHRRQLEENVDKLQRALQHWRMADAEYEQLKDEVEVLPETATDEELDEIKAEFDGEVVTEKDLEELLGSGGRSTARIINTISKRIDYVSKNVSTLERQLETAENKLAAATVVTNPDVRDEDGLPITDIVEELDDDDNITSYHLQQPGNLEPQIREALAKAGIKDLPENNEEVQASSSSSKAITNGKPDNEKGSSHADNKPSRAQKSASTKIGNTTEITGEAQQMPEKKGVSFAEDTKPGHDANSNTNEWKAMERTAKEIREVMEKAKEQAIPAADPVIPEDESEDEAELRREMLRYGMTDIAPIVAELEIGEGESDYDEGYSDEEYEIDEDEEDEDEHGRYKYRVVDDDYRQRMLELEQRLGIKSTKELAEDGGEGDEDEDDDEKVEGQVRKEGIARIAVQPPPVQPKSAIKPSTPTETKPKPAKKGVQFATSLDIAPDNATAPPAKSAAPVVEEPEEPFVDPMKSTIVERSATTKPALPATAPEPPKRTSRFKKARATTPAAVDDAALPIRQQPPAVPKGPADMPTRFLNEENVRTAPTGPEGKTLAGTIVERDAPSEVKEPDEFDAALLYQEAAVEYHKMRNRMILKDGGFVKEKEEEIEYPEEPEQSGKRVSRFKAARLAKQ